MACLARSFWQLSEDYLKETRKKRGRDTSSEDAAMVQVRDGVLSSCRGMAMERGGPPYLGGRIKDDDWIWE